MAARRFHSARGPLAAVLVALAISTVALASSLFVDEVDSKGEVLASAGQRLTSDEYVSEVVVAEPFSMPTELRGDDLVLRAGFLSKKKLMRDQAPQPTAVEPAESPTFANRLTGNFPNPFNPSTTIQFSLAQPGHTSMKIYDVRGRLVRTLVNQAIEPGDHSVRWDGRNDAGAQAASGVYFVRLAQGSFVQQHKVVMSR